MKIMTLLIFALLATTAIPRTVPVSEPIGITPTNQDEYGVIVSVKDSGPISGDFVAVLTTNSTCHIWIETPLVINKEKLSSISLISRDPNRLMTIPIHYTEINKIVPHPKSQGLVSMEIKYTQAFLCLPKEELADYVIAIDYSYSSYVVKPEAFFKQKNTPNQQVEPTAKTSANPSNEQGADTAHP